MDLSLRFTESPEASTVNDGGSVTLTGIATAEFKHNPTTIPGERVTNTGEIEYQWYIAGIAAEDVADKISGSQTNELTLSNLSNPTETGRSIFFVQLMLDLRINLREVPSLLVLLLRQVRRRMRINV